MQPSKFCNFILVNILIMLVFSYESAMFKTTLIARNHTKFGPDLFPSHFQNPRQNANHSVMRHQVPSQLKTEMPDHWLVHLCHNVKMMVHSKRFNVTLLRDIVGVLIRKEINEKKQKQDSVNLIANKVSDS